jgi:D-alanyl-lipoteichoic acid acyltransferase DltB (MBOAT superfamily)
VIFSDPVFLLIFVPISVLLHRLALNISESAAQWVLVLASLVFYSAWDVRWLPLLLGTIAMNLVIGRALIRKKRRSLFLLGLVGNLTPLLLAKYAGWLTGGYLFSDVVLPLGISFFTFQQIGFIADAYRGRANDVSVRHYTLFVTFFTQLIAGPICHWKEMTDQFRERFYLSSEDLTRALVLIAAGLFKKAVVADRLAPYAEALFDGGGVASLYEAWVGSLAYTFQLLFDFAGYCEMAMGLALLFGYKIPVNFLSPYKSLSVTEFWRRWHISLGRWFREFVYVPMGGNRHGATRMYIALFVTAFVSGLWHGAGMTFLIWGVMHGSALVVEKAGSRAGLSLPTPVRLILTFSFVSLAWVMFRAPDVDVALNIYASMLGLNGLTPPALFADMFGYQGVTLATVTGFEVFVMGGLLWWVWAQPNIHEISLRPTVRLTAGMGAAWALILFSITRPSAFLYWQF